MKPIDARPEADAAFDKWLRRNLRARYGAVAAAPVPPDLLRLARCGDRAGRAPPAARPDAESGDPALGLALSVMLSLLLWAAIAAVARWVLGF